MSQQRVFVVFYKGVIAKKWLFLSTPFFPSLDGKYVVYDFINPLTE